MRIVNKYKSTKSKMVTSNKARQQVHAVFTNLTNVVVGYHCLILYGSCSGTWIDQLQKMDGVVGDSDKRNLFYCCIDENEV
ncbi:hypothetical protein CEXT_705441 [Caerostris extrusa]|uniref:Uncharacterized protein n=1 Tax=Caerostris extrusa TaxID=172846 RepID=A0AAV4Q4P4_CAEEX|nr:hypothetical protein CEXT_705441 [Caerostris extrusa]